MSSISKGFFIVFEGGEGSGKSTQARMLSEALDQHGIRHRLTREPGDTKLGAKLRTLLLDRDGIPMSRKAEALLFAADRAEHVANVIKPALEKGDVVVCDRYSASTLAYQGYARGLNVDALKGVSDWASDGLQPDVTYYLDIRPVVGLARSKKVEHNRFEDEDFTFHDSVRVAFMAQRDRSWVTLNAEESVEDVHRKILDHTLHLHHIITGLQSDVVGNAMQEDPPAATTKRDILMCPICVRTLVVEEGGGNTVLVCPSRHGWVDTKDELQMWRPPHTLPTTLILRREMADRANMANNPGTCGFDGCVDHRDETPTAPRVTNIDISG